MRIAVDAMGGDFAPREIVAGAVAAAREFDHITKLFLVGDETAVRKELLTHGTPSDKIEIRHCTEVVGMGETPAVAFAAAKKILPSTARSTWSRTARLTPFFPPAVQARKWRPAS